MKFTPMTDKMGIGKSKSKDNSWKGKKKSGVNRQDHEYGEVGARSFEADYADLELMFMRRTLQRDPESFILNNLMMCIQFYKNYEEEINEIKQTLVSPREIHYNEKMPPQKYVLMPDILQEHIAKNMVFTSTRQFVRPTIEPLQPIRIYIVHDNIEITEQNYVPQYTSLNDTVMYNILLKPTSHEGYVQLQLLDESPRRPEVEDEYDDECSIITDSESLYDSRRISKPLARREKHLKESVNRSLPDLSESLYDERGSPLSTANSDSPHYSRDIKSESEYEAASVSERIYLDKINQKAGITTKHGAYQRNPRQPRSKLQWTANHSHASSTSSGYRSGSYAVDSDSDGSYNTLQSAQCSLKIAQNSERNHDDTIISEAKIPSYCFKKLTFTSDGKIFDPREERRNLNNKQRRIKLALRRHNYDIVYLNSLEFMTYFTNLFMQNLADTLGFENEDVEDIRSEGCVIYCDKVSYYTSRYSKYEPYEVIPSIWLEWPECAFEWLDRPRATWPNYEDIRKIKDFGCYVVPEGFQPKRGINSFQDLEWHLTFPAAERYLETCMSLGQVQVYLIALMLHKTFMRSVCDAQFGLTTTHIRNRLFWMIEEDERLTSWPEIRTGECLMKLLKTLYHSISQNEPVMPDYFMRDRNLFQKVPSEYLLHTQKQLKRIIENPIMYVFYAMENIRHSEKFFPKLDYEQLFQILTADTLTLINPALTQPIHKLSKAEDANRKKNSSDSQKYWGTSKKDQKIFGTRSVANKTLINPRKATDSIIEISIRCAELNDIRLTALLDFFVRHFIKMAEQCHQYHATQQKAVYLNQAERLSILLSEYPRCKEDARSYRDKINTLRKRLFTLNRMNSKPDEPPETPKRNVEGALFVAAFKDRFKFDSKEKKVNVTETKKQLEFENPVNSHETKTEVTVHMEQTDDSNKEQMKNDSSNEQKNISTLNKMVRLGDVTKDSYLSETTYI